MNQSEYDPMNRPAPIRLRPVVVDDLSTIYKYQLDRQANLMAVANPRSAEDFDAHWKESLQNPAVTARAIVLGEALVGHISCFRMLEQDWVGYWIQREYWGRGIATRALGLLLDEVATRPMHARVARENVASVCVLEKCGFMLTGYEWTEASERFPACEEAMFRLV